MKPRFCPVFQKSEPPPPPSLILELIDQDYSICSSSSSVNANCAHIPLCEHENLKKLQEKKRKVQFCSTATVMLIPTIEEYRQAKIHRQVWYSKKELKKIETNAVLTLSAGCLSNKSREIK
eukprot:gene9544-10362_t